MKLRQKLAVVLASAMIITAVPVTTMAASTNSFNKTLSIVADKEITTKNALYLTVDYADKDEAKAGGDVFFVNATDFEFNETVYKAEAWETGAVLNAKVEWLSKSQLKVTTKAGIGSDVVNIPIVGTPKKGNPAIAIDGEDSLATSGKYSLTGAEVVTDKTLVATAGDAKNISVDGAGVIADITIEEKVAGELAGKTITVTLPNSSDLIFNKKYATAGTDAKVTVEGKRGLAGVKDAAGKEITEVSAVYAKDDNKKIEITFPANYTANTRGSVVIKGIAVQAEDKKGDCSTGEVKVTVADKADKVMASTKLVVANVSDYGVSLTVDEVDELVAGQGTTKVKVKVKENAIDSLNKKQNVFFTIEEGRFVGLTAKTGFELNEDKDEITLDLMAKNDKGEYIFKDDAINEFEFEVEIAAKATHEGPVVIKAESRAFDEDLKVEVAKVTPAFEIKSEAITVKAGLKDQVGGKIVIKETKEERLAKNKEIRINCAEERYGFDIKDAKVEVTGGDVEIKSEVKDGEIIITVKRSSDEASEITISEIEVTTTRTIPEGTFDFQIGGDAIADLNKEVKQTGDDKEVSERFDDAITIEDFIVVSTKNTEDLPNAAAAKEIVLTVGATEYTVNKETKTADAAAFIDANNRTMVPVRFVAEEFGKIDFGTVNGVGTVTVFKDGNVLQFQNGSNIMNKNGIAIPMDTAVVIKDGRTFVPFKYVADGLGINYNFDAATKSITFTNQAK